MLFGQIHADHKVLAEQLKYLATSESEYHGRLQVMLSTARRITEKLVALIEEVEA